MADDIAIGIDLGTSYSCVSIVENGEPVVLPNEWGEANHASVVSFLEDGTVLVGNSAKRNIITNAESTVYSAKRLIGRYYFSDEVKKAQAVMPYRIVEGDEQLGAHPGPGPAVLAAGDLRPGPQGDEGHRRAVPRPRRSPRRSSPSRPTSTTTSARPPRTRAGSPGLEVLRILNEPTAAALAYGFGRDVNQRVVIYDLGGGTFDVSILEIGKDVFEVLSTAGDTYLGGDDFDDRIMTWLADDFLARTRLDLRQNKYCLQMLKEAAEQAKIDVGAERHGRHPLPEHLPGRVRHR